MTILFKPLALIGPMGCGKSSIGKILSKQLKYKFIDTDDRIINHLGMNIKDIFEKFGERYFRSEEEKLILNLKFSPDTILATGGGAVTSVKVRNFLTKNFLTIYLKSDIETLWSRISANKDSRPLINKKNGKNNLERLLSRRAKYYCQADITIDSKIHNEKLDVVRCIIRHVSQMQFSNSGEI